MCLHDIDFSERLLAHMESLFPLLVGIMGYLAVNFIGAPILEFFKLRREIHQKIIEYGNIWPIPTGLDDREILYLLERSRNAANEYRILSSRLKALAEHLQHSSFYCAARCALEKYNMQAAAGHLMALEPDALRPDKKYRDNQVTKLKEALRIKS